MSTPEPPDDREQEEHEEMSGQPVEKKKGKGGRPRKWPQERRIERIYQGRMSFKPGDEHQMDAQLEEARRLRATIVGELAELQGLMVNLAQLDDASEAISREEQAVTALLWDLYGTRKHRDHIVASFIAARRRRLLQRLQAAKVALEQARAFLSVDMEILPRLEEAIAEAEASSLAMHDPAPPLPEPAPAATDTQEELGEPGDSEPEVEELEEADETIAITAADQEEEQDGQADERRKLLRTVGGGDDATRTREALADFEDRVRLMRNAITDGRGWFEWYYVKRPRRHTQEATAYLARNEPIPPEVEKYEEDDRPPWGPYLRFRWYEGGVQYSIGMGHVRRRDEQREPSKPPKL